MEATVLLLLFILSACDPVEPVPVAVSVQTSALPDATRPADESLYQLLYAGEHGEAAYAAGQQARMLAWLAQLDPTPDQLVALTDLVDVRRGLEAEAKAEQAAIGEREDRLLAPIYDEIAVLYSMDEGPTQATLEPLADRLEAARVAVRGQLDPQRTTFMRVTRLFETSRQTVLQFQPDQRAALGAARFFMARSLGPLTTPGARAAQLGSSWDALDFAALKVNPRDAEEEEMDIGGLWAAERLDQAGSSDLVENQLTAILMVASGAPGLADALAVRVGQTAPANPAADPPNPKLQ